MPDEFRIEGNVIHRRRWWEPDRSIEITATDCSEMKIEGNSIIPDQRPAA